MDPSTCWYSQGVLTPDSWDIYLSTYFAVYNLRKIETMRLIFCCEMFETKCAECRRAAKNWEKIFSFLDNCIWISCGNFSLLQREYLSSGINVVKNGIAISNITKKDLFELKFSKSDEQIWLNYCRGDLGSVWDPLTFWLFKSVLKRDIIDI